MTAAVKLAMKAAEAKSSSSDWPTDDTLTDWSAADFLQETFAVYSYRGPASGRGVGMDAPLEEHPLAKPCCARCCTQLLTAEQNHQENLNSRSAIAIAIADGPNHTALIA